MRLFWTDVGYACFGIEADDSGLITDAAPIVKWMKGKRLSEVRPWLLKHKAKVIEIQYEKTTQHP